MSFGASFETLRTGTICRATYLGDTVSIVLVLRLSLAAVRLAQDQLTRWRLSGKIQPVACELLRSKHGKAMFSGLARRLDAHQAGVPSVGSTNWRVKLASRCNVKRLHDGVRNALDRRSQEVCNIPAYVEHVAASRRNIVYWARACGGTLSHFFSFFAYTQNVLKSSGFVKPEAGVLPSGD
jgi:hypothetical protein